jgi:uncharacterized membrane-anchored protein YjiN (DUF445 family)
MSLRDSMQEQEQLAQLKKMRWIATSLLAVMAILFVGAKLLQPTYGYLSFVGAFAEAAMVGALADWFAVTALFRKPFGLPIPHTAIIPQNKDRIGESVANFLQHNFMTHEVLSEEMKQIDFAGAATHWLSQPENSRAIATQVARAVPAVLRMVEDEDVGHFMQKAMRHSLENIKFAPLLAEVLSVLVAGRHHQALFDRMIGIVDKALEQNKPYIRQKVHEQSPRWMPKAIDEKFFERLMEGSQNILGEMQQEDSEWRDRFQIATEELIDKLRTSTEYEEKVAAVIIKGLGHPLFRDYTDHVWRETKQRLLADTTSPESKVVAKLDDALRALSNSLMQDAAVRNKLNHWIRTFAARAIADRRDVIAALVKRVIQKWDAETVSKKFELHVGKDLQYIRINGTLVGGMVGLILHVISSAL